MAARLAPTAVAGGRTVERVEPIEGPDPWAMTIVQTKDYIRLRAWVRGLPVDAVVLGWIGHRVHVPPGTCERPEHRLSSSWRSARRSRYRCSSRSMQERLRRMEGQDALLTDMRTQLQPALPSACATANTAAAHGCIPAVTPVVGVAAPDGPVVRW